MNTVSNFTAIVCAIFMIIGVISSLFYGRKVLRVLLKKKIQRDTSFNISFFHNSEMIYKNGFSIIPQQGTNIILECGGNTDFYFISSIIYKTNKDTKKTSNIDIIVQKLDETDTLLLLQKTNVENS